MTDTTRLHLLAAALLGAAVLGACGRGAPAGSAAQTSSRRAALSSGAGCPETSAHAKHVNLFACKTCHPQGAVFGFDQPYTFAGGTTTAGGTITLGANGAATTCAVACHFPKGAPAKTVAWNVPGPLACTDCHATSALPQGHPAVAANATRADCQACHVTSGHLDGAVLLVAHDAAWMDRASPAFHAFSADAGLAACQKCHAADLSGGATHVSCAQCHDVKDAGGVVVKAWRTNCTMCHGGVDDQSGAPPAATWGHAGDPNRGGGTLDAVRVGAHRVHLAGSALAPPFGCGVCHQTPADALSDGHVDGPTAGVSFAGLAADEVVPPLPPPAWDRASATCSSTYCHGATLVGGRHTTPVWTGGSAEAACDACHGVPPVSSKHPAVSSNLAACNPCHALTIDASGAMIPPGAGGKHLDGIVEATGGHPAAWMDPASEGFHAVAVNAGIAACQGCHGAALDGVGGAATTSCASCHDANLPAGVASWKVNCTMCHGGVANATGAPPAGTWGHRTDPLRVGAHTVHVTATATKVAYACASCHVTPSDALSAGHVDGGATSVVWGALARTGGANPTFDRTTGTCSGTYCHGSFSGTFQYFMYEEPQSVAYSGKGASVGWTDGPMTCESCHANPPPDGNWHLGHTGGCDLCHPDANAAGTAITNAARHVDGVVDVTPVWKSSCYGCH